MIRLLISSYILLFSFTFLAAQPERWQQRVEYTMNIDFDNQKHQFKGTQKLVYFNNSPDTLYKVFYHLYFNAFQPGSMMDVRSSLIDADPRVGSRISKLQPNEIGYQKINTLTQNGKPAKFEVVETILEVELADPIFPNSQTVFEMNFEAQVPIQIRRSGRNNEEDIDYSMAQWYPKMCEYDYQGWHANPYIAREFYGVWGNFDVTINIERSYVVAASGYLQNPQEVGHGYEQKGMKLKLPKSEKLAWHFVAPNVHDFLWAADPEYTHTQYQAKDGTMLHFFYKETEKNKDAWEALPAIMDDALQFVNRNYGQYPYKRYSFIQGGDGGMEYPMATLITGERQLSSLVGVAVHEMIHSWYQMVLGSNESLYAWMDEGFTSYASNETMNYLRLQKRIQGEAVENPQLRDFKGYIPFLKSGYEEPLITHADHFKTNRAYGVGSYTKGSIFLKQLEYVIGKEAFKKGLLRYFETWKFKHPNANDFIRVMEKQSGLELDWYREYFINTTYFIDYGVQSVKGNEVILNKIGLVPMPLDVLITYQDDTQEMINIPLSIMLGAKQETFGNIPFRIAKDWFWTHPTYTLSLQKPVKSVEIDPYFGMLDVESGNNKAIQQ